MDTLIKTNIDDHRQSPFPLNAHWELSQMALLDPYLRRQFAGNGDR